MYRFANTFVSITAVAIISLSSATAAEWGSIKGRLMVEGQPPKPNPLVVTKDQFCIDNPPLNETIIVGEDGALANVVVYLRAARPWRHQGAGRVVKGNSLIATEIGSNVIIR
ncbi:MAG TPA: hypothetical protein VJ828_17265 [Lacipirellulaceae bacterium]|nr:hypothetical protein [Lacipirellulaceae bacterium]